MSVSIFDFSLELVPLIPLLIEMGMSGFVVVLTSALDCLAISLSRLASALMSPLARVAQTSSKRVRLQAGIGLPAS